MPVSRTLLQIMVAGAIVLMTIWIGVLVRLSVEKVEVLQVAQARANVLAEALAQHTETTVHDIDVIALVVKREFEFDHTSVDLKALQGEGFFSRATAAQVSIVDATGCILQSTIPYAGGVYISDREHFTVQKKDAIRGLYISKPVLGRVSGIWTIQLTRRLDGENGQFAGVVVVSEDRRYLTADFSNVADLGDEGTAAVFLENGTKLSDGRPDVGADDRRGAAEKTKPSFDNRIVARRPVRGYPLVVEISLSRNEAMVPYVRMKSAYLAASAVFSIFVVIFLVAISALIQRLSKSRNRLQVLSETDTLTGLWNRHGLLARLDAMLSRQTKPYLLSVVYIDLGNLKRVNDMLGHEAGDQLLKKVATRLQEGLEPSILGRFGGDEFIAILTAVDTDLTVYPVTKSALRKVADIFEMPITLRGSVFDIRVSVGVAIHARVGDGVSTLIREADEAMYSAKSEMKITQKTTWKFYSDEMRETACRALDTEQRLRFALRTDALKLVFHSIRNLARQSVWGLRIAVALDDETHGLLLVRDAVPVTQENGLLAPVTEFVVRQMCATVSAQKNSKAVEPLLYRLAINQFLTTDCASIVRSVLGEFQITPDALVFEVPESAFFEEPVLAEKRATALLSTGARLLLYEFVGGFASFGLLEKGLFFGVLVGARSVSNKIFPSVMKHLAQTGLMVIVESRDPLVGLGSGMEMYATRSFDPSLNKISIEPSNLLDESS